VKKGITAVTAVNQFRLMRAAVALVTAAAFLLAACSRAIRVPKHRSAPLPL